MRIAIITETYLPSTDGIVTRLTRAVDYLSKQGHQVLVIAPAIPGLPQSDHQVAIQGARTFTFFLYKERPWALPDPRIKQWLADFQPDLVHAVNPASLTAAGVHYAKRLKIPLIASFHTNLPDYADRYHLSFVKPVLWRYLRHLHNQASLNLVTSQAMYDLLDQHGIHDLAILPKGVAIEDRHPHFYSSQMRQTLMGEARDKKLLLFVGRLAHEKEIDSLRSLFDRRQDICLAIVGDGPARKHLETVFAGTPTVFTGFLHGEALSQAYASSDAFIFPSRSETLGLVITEAMASGIPVIAAESEPTLEQVRHERTGLIYQTEDIGSLDRAIDQLDDAVLVEALKKSGRQYAEGFSWEHASQALEAAYQETIRRVYQ